ncbi:EAL domain-containing protein [Zoogloea sp.]|uniref:bifunctional diguanylate cyclase/phosphodiesterase n=1 Tax=Zoogloea sp. TaxID=49181 RepID=UPI00262EC401|nr:EAL domain-containing protein [Zoogloea sp.]MDD3353748.1 EAL domain-containing protein [Zoogloea sp.]
MPFRLRISHPGFLLLVTLAIALLLGYVLGTARQDLHRQAERDARNITGILEARMDASLRRVQASLEELASELPLSALAPDAPPALRERIRQQLARRARHFPEISGFRLVDAAGRLRHASEMEAPDISLQGRDYYEVLRRDPALELFFSEVVIGRIHGHPQFYVVKPIRNADGSLAGLVVAAFDLNYVRSLFDAVDLGPNGVITFRRSDDGRLVLRRPEQSGTVNKGLRNNPMHMRIEAGALAGTIRYQATLDGIERIYAYQRVGNYPFYVATGIATRDYLAQWYRRVLGAVSGAAACVLALTILLARLRRSEIRVRQAAVDLQDSEDRFQLLLNSVGEGICGIDQTGHHLFSNPAARAILGYTDPRALEGRDIVACVQTHDAEGQPLPAELSPIRHALAGGTSAHSADEVFTRSDGSRFPVQYDVYPLVREGREDGGAVLLFSDITERRRNEERIEFLAHHDPLTSLPNRLLAEDRFEQARAYADRAATYVALLFLDLDGFKTVNDSLGHDVGDEMLKALAQRLRRQLRESDTVCRLGGDEFLLILSGLQDLPVLVQRLGRLLACVAAPVELSEHRLSTSVSIGVALYPSDGRDFTILMKKADMAMYHAKDAGRNTYRMFDEAMDQQVQESMLLRANFDRALSQGEFVLHFQPLIELVSGAVVGAEALVRWQDPERGLIPPAQFIPVAESSGLIVPLGEWVLEEACRRAVEWNEGHGREQMVAVNISAIQFKRGNLAETVARILGVTGLPPHLLEIELTESTLLHHTDQVMATLRVLRDMGVRLSIDDFGTGYSSLAYLKRLAVNKLKIDQSFVRDLTRDPEDLAIVRAIIEMAHSLNLVTLAEGVEDEGVLEVLRRFGCDEVQGYHFARPLPLSDFRAYLAKQSI